MVALTDQELMKKYRRLAINTLEDFHELGPQDFSEGKIQQELYERYHGAIDFDPALDRNHQEELAMQVWREEFHTFRQIHQV